MSYEEVKSVFAFIASAQLDLQESVAARKWSDARCPDLRLINAYSVEIEMHRLTILFLLEFIHLVKILSV
jgi:hypothetical protein